MSYKKLFAGAACFLGVTYFTNPQGFSNPGLRSLTVNEEPTEVHRGLTAYDPNFESLNIAVFGSSQAYGAGLDNRFEAFPYLLSSSVDNYAAFSAGPNYPSVCIHSMIGDEKTYDVILLQYFLKAHDGLMDLALRLRARYPKAVIIVMKFWGPFDAYRKVDAASLEKQTFKQWKESVAEQLPNGQLNELVDLLQDDNGVWGFPNHEAAEKEVTKVIHEIGGYRFHLPSEDTAKDTVAGYLRFFDAESNTHLSIRGHSYVANMTHAIIHEHILTNQISDISELREMSPWDDDETCKLWFTTGACDLDTDMPLNQYDTTHGKYALEVPSGGGYFMVNNTFGTDRPVYISFMSTDTGTDYPTVTVTHENLAQPIDLVPYGPDINGAGIVRTVQIGVVPANSDIKVLLAPHQADTNPPFRVVGVTLPPASATPNEYHYAPIFNV